ncbi:MAG: thiamine pyrophosphate-dependent enzyme, partial [Limisphaerales bacterium]
HQVQIPVAPTATHHKLASVAPEAPDFVQRITGMMLANKGDQLPVSVFTPDGSWPSGTTKWEKRAIALDIPEWDSSICIQCNKCVLICPHAAIRAKWYNPAHLSEAPATFKAVDFRSNEHKGSKYSLQVAPEDCTGCTLCFEICPVKSKADPKKKALNMVPMGPLCEQESKNFKFFLELPNPPRTSLVAEVKSTQFMEPLFEFSGACSGCGETPYVKLLTQMYGDRLIIANATGCSSIYGGNLPTTPYTANSEGRGPAWSNSLFEDNAEYGLGQRIGVDKQTDLARLLLKSFAPKLGDSFVDELLNAPQSNEAEFAQQRARVRELKQRLQNDSSLDAARLYALADFMVRKSVWILGGDGWAYDIGFGGLDHVIASNIDVNILVLDTEVYSNTGGQSSKSTPIGAAAKFAAGGKRQSKKDLGLIAMTYGSAYVAQIAMGAKDNQAIKAFEEAESHRGTSLIIAYSPCIAHGYGLGHGLDQQKLAVDTGYWPLYRFDPRRAAVGEPALKLDSPAPKSPLEKFWAAETRFQVLSSKDPEAAKQLLSHAQSAIKDRYAFYEKLAAIKPLPATNGDNAVERAIVLAK